MNRILIVEDEPRLASFLEKGLRANGFVTTTSRDGYEATMLATRRRLRPDGARPRAARKDGLTVLRDVRSAGHRLPGDHPQRARRHRRTRSPGSSAAPTTT